MFWRRETRLICANSYEPGSRQRVGRSGAVTVTDCGQTGYFDHVLRNDESIQKHALYIVSNPVRAGLTMSVGDYPFARILEENAREPEA